MTTERKPRKREGRSKGVFRRGSRGAWLLLGAAAVLLAVAILVSASTLRRNALEAPDALWDGSWYGDDLGCIEGDAPLVEGMKAFEKRTGVRPYLTLLSDVAPEDLSAYAKDQYDALFDEDGHVLVVYDEWGESRYYLAAWAEEKDLAAADREALLDCIEEAYADGGNGSFAAAFGAGFAQAAQRMPERSRSSGALLLVLLALALGALAGALLWRLRKKDGVFSRSDPSEG